MSITSFKCNIFGLENLLFTIIVTDTIIIVNLIYFLSGMLFSSQKGDSFLPP